MGGIRQGNPHVMRNHDNGNALTVQLLDDFVHLRRGLGIQTGNGFIQQEALLGGAQRPCQQHPLLLPAGQLPVAPALKALQPKLFQIGAGCGLFFLGVEGSPAPLPLETGKHNFQHRGGEIPLHLGLLGQIANLGGLQSLHVYGASQGRGEIQNGFHQGGLAGAVFSHDAQIVPGVDRKVQTGDNGFSVIAQGGIFTYDLGHPAFLLRTVPVAAR